MAGLYLVRIPLKSGMTFRNGNDSVILWADTSTQAKSLASAAMAGDVPKAAWDDANVFIIATASIMAGTDLEGWTYTINLTDNLAPFTLISVSVTGTFGQDIDAIGSALATALNATVINGAAYVGASNTLTIVDVADGMGDWLIDIRTTPPGGVFPVSTSNLVFGDPTEHVTGMFGAITAPGAAGIARTVVFTDIKPSIFGVLKLEPF
jgi:hypothetical protein